MVSITLLSTIDQIGGFIYRVLITRAVGPEGLGYYQIAMSIIFVLVSIACSGIPFVVSSKIAEYKTVKDMNSVGGITSASLIITITLSSVLILIFTLCKDFIISITNSTEIINIAMILLPCVLTLSIYSCFRGALWGNKNYLIHSGLEVIEAILRLILAVLLFGLVTTSLEASKLAAIIYSSTCLFSAILSYIFWKKQKFHLSNPKKFFLPLIKKSIPLSGIRVAGNIFSSLIAVVFPMQLINLANYTMAEAVTEYGIIFCMTLPLLSVSVIFIGAITTALLPEIASNIKTNKMSLVRYHLSRAINFSMLFGAMCIGCYVAFGEEICILLFNNAKAGIYLKYSCIMMVPLSLCLLSTNLLSCIGIEYKSGKNYIIGALILIFSICFLPALCGSISIIIGAFVGISITAILNIRLICKSVNLQQNFFRTFIFLLLMSGFSGLSGIIFFNLLSAILPYTISLIISFAITIAAFLVLSSMFNIADIVYMWRTVFKFRKNDDNTVKKSD